MHIFKALSCIFVRLKSFFMSQILHIMFQFKSLMGIALLAFSACSTPSKTETTIQNNTIELITSFKGQQVTGITVDAATGRTFVNFPRWNDGIENSVVEILKDGSHKPYPNADWNSLQLNKTDLENLDTTLDKSNLFLGVQSVYAFENKLYILDTRNAFWQGIIDAPRIFVFDLQSNTLEDILILEEGSFALNSYVNDLRIDKENQIIIMTDSNEPALIIYDLKNRKSKRVLEQHPSTKAEKNHLNIAGNIWKNTVHSDGIAFDSKNKIVYFHALTGHNLYAISSQNLLLEDTAQIAKNVKLIAKTAAPDGMVFDNKGNLFFADLENSAIHYLTPNKEIKTLVQNPIVGWADSFSIYGEYLYFTNSKIHEKGDISAIDYPVYKINISHL